MQHTMKRRCGSDALVLSVVLVVSVMGASFAGDVHHERAAEEETIGDQSSSGEGGDIAVARSEVNFGQPAEEHSLEEETASPSKAAAAAAAAAATREDDGGQEMTTTTGQSSSSSSSSDAAEAGGEAVAASPSAKVILWEESVDLATVDPNQDEQAAAGGGGGGGSRERKEPRPSQERHSDVEASKKKEGEAEEGEESQIVSEGRLHVNSASSLSSSSIWNTALFAVFGSAVILFLMKNDVDSTSKQIYIRYSNTQCKRSEEMSGREQLTCQFTHHSSAPIGIATSMAIQNS